MSRTRTALFSLLGILLLIPLATACQSATGLLPGGPQGSFAWWASKDTQTYDLMVLHPPKYAQPTSLATVEGGPQEELFGHMMNRNSPISMTAHFGLSILMVENHSPMTAFVMPLENQIGHLMIRRLQWLPEKKMVPGTSGT